MNEKKLLKKLGEETLYSAKGHFKACDLRRNFITCTIWFCALVNVLGVYGIHPDWDRLIATFGLIGTIGLLIWDQGEGKNYRAKHKEAAEKYLALHKEIRSCFFLSDCNKLQVEILSNRVIEFDKSDKPDIPGFARRMAKRAIERRDSETDNWFLEK